MPVSTAAGTTNTRGKPPTHPSTNSVPRIAHAQLPLLPLQQTTQQLPLLPPPPSSLSSAPAAGGVGQAEALPQSQTAHCKHCEEFGIKGGGGGSNGGSIYWRLHLDRDLLETIISIYPEWFKDCNVTPGAMAEGGPCGLGASPTPPSSPSSSSSAAASNSSGGLRRKSVSSASAAAGAAASAAAASASSSPPPHSPPKAQVDDSPLQKSMDRNKESLKVKLMLRRPINQLVAQGIMPPLKTPPAFHEQRQKLERAKTGDLLKAKIQQRPNRTELVRQHILEADMGHVDPSLAERQRMLKKARLQDTLNDQLSHRPGPLELIQKNILHTEEIIERAVKEGQISFKATCEGHLSRPQHPSHYVTFEEDSGGSSEGAAASPPSQSQSAISSAPSETPIPHSPGLASTTSSLSPLSSVSSPQSVAPPAALPPPPPPPTLPTPPPPPRSTPVPTPAPQNLTGSIAALQQTPTPSPSSTTSALQSSSLPQVSASTLSAVLSAQKEQASSSSSKNRKKSKTKSQPKTRTIKFHEYKGPPNAQRNSSSLVSPPPVETSYELLLQQQQLFLQWQLEWQHKYPQIILPAAQKPSDVGLITVTTPSSTPVSGNLSATSSAPPPTPPPQPPPSTTPIFLQAQSPGFSASQGSISAAPSPAAATTTTANSPSVSSVSVSAPPSSSPSPKDLAALRCLPPKMEDMKVSDLKAELKKRNLPVSGSKPQLIERLRSYAESAPSAGGSTCVQMGSPPAQSPGTPTAPPPPPPPPPLPPPPQQISPHQQFSSTTSSQQAVFGVEAGVEDSLPGLQMDSPVVSPSGASMDALPSPSSSPPPSLFIQNKATPASAAMTLQVFSPASEMEVDPEAAVVVILAPPTASNGSPPAPLSSPPPQVKQGPASPPASSSPPLRPPPPPPPLPPPPVQSAQNALSSSTQAMTEGNIIIGNDIIAQQQKKIEELQRELLRSQYQLQCERQKEQRQLLLQQQLTSQAQQRSGGQASSTSAATDLKPTHRLVLQQHLQNKLQQQQLQIQLQQLQNMQLQQKQQQLRLLQHQKEKQASATKASGQHVQQQQQSQAIKANLAAFLQQQNSTTTANNNNVTQAANNNNNNNNLKKGANSQQQQKVVLNQFNLLNKAAKAGILTASGNKAVSGAAPNGIIGHHRTASLPNFFSTTFGAAKSTQQQPIQGTQQLQQQIEQQVTVLPPGTETQKEMEGVEGGLGSTETGGIDVSPSGAVPPPSPPSPSQSPAPSPQQFLITKLPPHYEEATKLLKVKMESGTNTCSPGGGSNEADSPRNTSSKSVKSQIVDDVLEILIKNGELPPSAANDPATPTTPGRSLPHGLIFASTTATTTASTQSSTPITSIAMVHQPVTQLQPSFPSLILPEVKTEEMSTDKHVPSTDSEHLFHPFDFVLGADASPTPLHRVASQETTSHRDNHSSHELLPLQQTEDLGLDLEALDVMEFDLLGGPPAPTPVSHIEMGPVSPVTPDGRGMDHITETHLHNSIPRDEDVDMEAVVGSGAGGELSEMPMDLDVSDWLDSLIAPAGASQNGGASPFHHQSLPQPPQYDPLLSHSHDPFDLFDDAELRMASWDRVDFAA